MNIHLIFNESIINYFTSWPINIIISSANSHLIANQFMACAGDAVASTGSGSACSFSGSAEWSVDTRYSSLDSCRTVSFLPKSHLQYCMKLAIIHWPCQHLASSELWAFCLTNWNSGPVPMFAEFELRRLDLILKSGFHLTHFVVHNAINGPGYFRCDSQMQSSPERRMCATALRFGSWFVGLLNCWLRFLDNFSTASQNSRPADEYYPKDSFVRPLYIVTTRGKEGQIHLYFGWRAPPGFLSSWHLWCCQNYSSEDYFGRMPHRWSKSRLRPKKKKCASALASCSIAWP